MLPLSIRGSFTGLSRRQCQESSRVRLRRFLARSPERDRRI